MGESEAVEIDWADFFGRYRPLAVRVALGLVGREEVAEDELAQALTRVLDARDDALRSGTAARAATWFDVLTAAAMLIFAQRRVE